MKDRAHIEVAAHPDIELRIRMKPFEFEIGGQASFALTTGDILVRGDEIPVVVAIPFLSRRVVAGSVGPFGIHIRPFEAQFRAFGFDARGVLGRKDAKADVGVKGECKAEIEILGKLADQAVQTAIKTSTEE